MDRGGAKRPSRVLDDPILAVGRLDPRRRLDGTHRIAHPLPVIGPQGGLFVQTLQGVDLVEMQVGVDEGLGHEPPGRVHNHRGRRLRRLVDGLDPSPSDGDVVQRTRPASQPRPPDQEIEWFTHGVFPMAPG